MGYKSESKIVHKTTINCVTDMNKVAIFWIPYYSNCFWPVKVKLERLVEENHCPLKWDILLFYYGPVLFWVSQGIGMYRLVSEMAFRFMPRNKIMEFNLNLIAYHIRLIVQQSSVHKRLEKNVFHWDRGYAIKTFGQRTNIA